MCPSSTFQPTHLLEVRHARCFYIHMSEAFQPTHPHGMRLTTLDRKVGVRVISTHASSWDATAMIVEACKSILYRVIPRNYFFS